MGPTFSIYDVSNMKARPPLKNVGCNGAVDARRKVAASGPCGVLFIETKEE
jgi:hypothetical protein